MQNKEETLKNTLMLADTLTSSSPQAQYNSFIYFGNKFNEKNLRVDLNKLIENYELELIKQKCNANHIKYEDLDEIERDDLQISNLHKGLMIYLIYGVLNGLNNFSFENFHFYLTYSGVVPVSFKNLYITCLKTDLKTIKDLIAYLFTKSKAELIDICTLQNTTWKTHQEYILSHNWLANETILEEFNEKTIL